MAFHQGVNTLLSRPSKNRTTHECSIVRSFLIRVKRWIAQSARLWRRTSITSCSPLVLRHVLRKSFYDSLQKMLSLVQFVLIFNFITAGISPDRPHCNQKPNKKPTLQCAMSALDLKYKQDGEEAKEIAKYLPYFPFKGIDRFYDIGGFLAEPEIFQKIVDIFVERYRAIGIDSVAGLDARGFILGPPIALALKKPFIMMRKKGKMPNTIESEEYKTEYGNRSGLTVQRDKIKKGDRVLIIDDLVATGGTLSSAISLVKQCEATVVECACVVELKMFIDPPEGSGLPSRTKSFQQLGHQDVPVWGLISEDILLNEADLPEGYVDDGEEH